MLRVGRPALAQAEGARHGEWGGRRADRCCVESLRLARALLLLPPPRQLLPLQVPGEPLDSARLARRHAGRRRPARRRREGAAGQRLLLPLGERRRAPRRLLPHLRLHPLAQRRLVGGVQPVRHARGDRLRGGRQARRERAPLLLGPAPRLDRRRAARLASRVSHQLVVRLWAGDPRLQGGSERTARGVGSGKGEGGSLGRRSAPRCRRCAAQTGGARGSPPRPPRATPRGRAGRCARGGQSAPPPSRSAGRAAR
mmetsp:Transcript_20891/g.69020  ORF Transcript_20891/g.69020 Transcript_20891/m.69020 type:complete len:255 (+) Transcript_20891:258-1022(+)